MGPIRRVLPIMLVLGLFGVPANEAIAAKPPLQLVTCNQTVTHSIRVANNLLDCPDRGLIVGKSGITIDLNGHRLDANAASSGTTGIDNGAFSGVKVTNGVLTDWDTGTFTEHAKDITISRLYMRSVGNGIILDDVRDGSVTQNTMAGVAATAIGMDLGSRRLTIRSNRLYEVGGTAISVVGASEDAVITKNRIVRAGDGVFVGVGGPSTVSANRIVATTGNALFFNTDGGTVERNRVDGAGGHGIVLGDSGRNQLIEANIVRGGNLSGIAIDDNVRTRVVANTVVANDEHGILVQQGERNVVSRNTASENGGHGIYSDTGDVKIADNVANLNGFHNGLDDNAGFGIFAPLGTSGRGNTARENDNAAQCADITCGPGPVLGFTPVLQTCNSVVPPAATVRIVNNLENCPSHGLNTSANGQEVDLAGHRIEGAGAGHGINAPHQTVTIRDGTIEGFVRGISLAHSISVFRTNVVANTVHGLEIASGQGVLSDNVAVGNGGAGMHVGNSGAYEVTRNVSVGNTGRGIQLLTVTTPVVKDNESVGNDLDGLQMAPALSGEVKRNLFALNGVDGIFAGVSTDSMTITKNRVIGNVADGIRYAVASNCIASENTVTGNGANGVALIATASSNTFEENVIGANTFDGFDSLATTSGTALVRNTASRNGGHGIESEDTTIAIRGNRADRNGFINGVDDQAGLGINLPYWSVSSNNTAKNNDDPNECEISALECHRP